MATEKCHFLYCVIALHILSPLFNVYKWDWFLLFCIVFDLMAGGIGLPVKAVLVYCFHKLNKAQNKDQKIDFLFGVEAKGRLGNL